MRFGFLFSCHSSFRLISRKETMTAQKTHSNPRRWQLPFGFFAGPILWGLQILVGYGLVSVACYSGNKLPVLLTIAVSGLIVLAGAVVTFQAWNSMRQADNSIWMDSNQAQESSAFWAISGFITSIL